MVLQNLQFPPLGDPQVEMYFRFNAPKGILDSFNRAVNLEKGNELNFNTYFNTFSYEKWVNYTNIGNVSLMLKLKGEWDIILVRLELNLDGSFAEYVLTGQRFDSDCESEIVLEYPQCPAKGILSFRLASIRNSSFYGGAYGTDTDVFSLPEVNLALCVCTYRREDYIGANVKMLNDNVFNEPASMLKGHLRVYIADNGQTLDKYGTSTDEIKIFPNINSGGAGGFSRGMIEALAEREKHGLTHIIFMDDDVVFTHYALERLYVFLKMIKPKYADSAVIGAMLWQNARQWQCASGEIITQGYGISSPKRTVDLNDAENVLRNEVEESVTYGAWWFNCFRFDDSVRGNFPMPFFFQWDDIEYQMRTPRYVISLNGVCLWHEAFEKKVSMSKDYYIMRNRMISASIHSGHGFSKWFVKKLLIWHTAQNIWIYRYKASDLLIRAAEDYFKGFEWLTAQNPQELNKEIMSLAESMHPVRELHFGFVLGNLRNNFDYRRENIFKRFIRRITVNGWLLPAKGEAVVQAVYPNKSFFYRKKRVLNYDYDTQKGFITVKSWREAWRVCLRLLSVLRLIDRNFDKTVKKYKEEYPKYTTEAFWREYLGI